MNWARKLLICIVFIANSLHIDAILSGQSSEFDDHAKHLKSRGGNKGLEVHQERSSKEKLPDSNWSKAIFDFLCNPWRQAFSAVWKIISRTGDGSAVEGNKYDDFWREEKTKKANTFFSGGPEGGPVHMGAWSEITRDRSCPPMFVVVMSKRDSFYRRENLRTMWQQASHDWGSNVVAKFGICSKIPSDENDDVEQSVQKEQKTFNDILLMDCDEGYLDHLLTLKTMAAMKSYLKRADDSMLFMKTDDDTFVSLPRLCQFISDNAVDIKHSYIGVFAEDGERMEKKHPPCRDPESDWFEPWNNFDRQFWPVCAKGGPGYILSHQLVKDIMNNGVADAYVLNNEDKAVGVWVNELVEKGAYKVAYVNLPGTDGYIEYHEHIKTYGAWDWYPYVLHHHLDGKEIKCLHNLQSKGVLDARVDDCFTVHKAQQGPTSGASKVTSKSNGAVTNSQKKGAQALFRRRGKYDEVEESREAQTPRDLFQWKRQNHFLDHMTQAEFLSCMGIS